MKVIDAFCGAGGLSCGFYMAGFNIVLGIDIDLTTLYTFKLNHPNSEVWLKDVRSVKELPEADILLGGPPCPEFSMAKAGNKRNPEKGMELVHEFLRLKDIVNPKYWIMENVPPIKDYISYKDFPRINIFCSADFGVPQTRYRCIAGKYPTPEQTHSETSTTTLLGKNLRKWKTVREAIGDLPSPILSVKRSKKGDDVTGQPYFHINEPSHTIATTPPRTVKLEGRAIDYYKNKFLKALEKPSNTIEPTGYLTFGERIRDERGKPRTTSLCEKRIGKLTVKQCARLQSFPDWYIFTGRKNDQYRQIGNAVPPLMSFHFAKKIMEIEGRHLTIDFENWCSQIPPTLPIMAGFTNKEANE